MSFYFHATLQLHNSPVDCVRAFKTLKTCGKSSSLQWQSIG